MTLIWPIQISNMNLWSFESNRTQIFEIWKKKILKGNHDRFYGNLDDHLRWIYDEISLVDNLQKAVTEPFWEIFISNLKWKLPNHVQRQYQKVLEEKWLENFFEFHIYSTYFQKNRSCLLSDSNMDIYKIKNRRLNFSKLDGPKDDQKWYIGSNSS